MGRRSIGTARAVAILAALAIGASACGSSDDGGSGSDDTTEANQAAPTDEGEATPGGTLKVAVPAEIDGLNPASNRWSIEGNTIASSVFDPLLTFDEDRQLVPKLAESVEPNDEGTVWTITIREGIEFHDGTPFDAEAVKMNIDMRKANPLSGGALAPIQEVVVTSPTTVEVRMSTPWFGYDYTLAAQGGYMAAPSQLESENSIRQAIGTGPFQQVGQFSSGQPIVVERNEDYWGDEAYLDGIEFSVIVDAPSRQSALESGDVDMILTEEPSTITDLRDADGIVQVEDVASEEAYIMLNLAVPPFDNENARLALAHATDQEALIAVIGDEVVAPADGPFTEGERYHPEESGYPEFDPAAAEEALAAYTEETGEETLSFTIETSQGPFAETAEALAGQWADYGIDANVEVLEQSAFLLGVFNAEFEAAAFRNFGYVNPDSNYIFWHSSQAKGIGGGSINFGQLKDETVDDLLDTARETSDEDVRLEQYQDITPALNAALPYIWLYHTNWALAANEDVGGLTVPQALGFARQDAKTWWNQIWLDQS